ncbi:hypothetical protein [Amycolatopsis methanolica]|uniref:hypothetical protein n=1 Tax=Amycolatopsis methanolica TaxID=1814 RepID=UPI003416AF54
MVAARGSIGFYHAPYDLLVLFVPVALGIGMAVRGELTRTADCVAVRGLAAALVSSRCRGAR